MQYAVSPKPGRVRWFLQRCEKCRSLVEQYRANEHFMAQCQTAAAESQAALDEETRTRLIDTCKKLPKDVRVEDQRTVFRGTSHD